VRFFILLFSAEILLAFYHAVQAIPTIPRTTSSPLYQHNLPHHPTGKPRTDTGNAALGHSGFEEGKIRQGVRKNEQIIVLQKTIEEKNTDYITI